MRKLCSSNPRISVFHCPRSALKTLKGFTTSNLLILLLPPQHRNSPSDQNSLSQTILMLQSSKQEFPSNPSKPVHKKTTRNQTHTNQFSASIKIKNPFKITKSHQQKSCIKPLPHQSTKYIDPSTSIRTTNSLWLQSQIPPSVKAWKQTPNKQITI